MCIYYGDKPNLTYNSQEHIFPASIGGIEKLPKGYVSDQANEYFSRLESAIITNSFIGLHKSFYGPGKRGSNELGRMPISLFSSENADNESLGFVFNAKPHYIPQIILSNDMRNVHIVFDKLLQNTEDIEKLVNAILNNKLKYTVLTVKPKTSKFIVGIYKNRLYVALNKEELFDECLEYIKTEVIPRIDFTKTQYEKEETPIVNISMNVSISNDSRVFAKIALNFLAKLKGKEYLNKGYFDEIKEWILGKSNNRFEQLPQNPRISFVIPENLNVHYCTLLNADNRLIAMVTLYNYWTMAFSICDAFDPFFNTTRAIFCDYKKREEYSLEEYIDQFIVN